MLRSKKLERHLLGKNDGNYGGMGIRSYISYPQDDGSYKSFYFEGNKGIIVSLIEKMDKLEKRIEVLESKIIKK